jgi:hypothetical protein
MNILAGTQLQRCTFVVDEQKVLSGCYFIPYVKPKPISDSSLLRTSCFCLFLVR